jgi:hypothetical protein
MGRSNLVWLGLGVGALAIAGCSKPAEKAPETTAAAVVTETPAIVEPAYPTRALFGDTHVHTGWSADAGLDGAITSPEDAFRMARGEEVKSNTGQMAKLRRPLDWMVITDHSDGMGTINEIRAANPEMLADPTIKRWSEAMNSGDEDRNRAAVLEAIDLQSNGKLPAEIMNPKWMVTAWEKTIAIADKYNEPGKFTALIGYEWTPNVAAHDVPDHGPRETVAMDVGVRGEDGRPAARHPAQRQSLQWAHVRGDHVYRRTDDARLRRGACEVGAAVRGVSDQGPEREPPEPVAQR